MRANIQITFARQEIEAFCRKWKIIEFSLFGSVLRDDFRPDSDIDVLLTFSPEEHWRYYNLLDMKDELKESSGERSTSSKDVLSRKAKTTFRGTTFSVT